MKSVRVAVNDRMQQSYVYYRTKPMGREFRAEFQPELTPQEMLELGVFGGRYMTDCREEFPASWFKKAKLSPERHEPALNFFGVTASQPLDCVIATGHVTLLRDVVEQAFGYFGLDWQAHVGPAGAAPAVTMAPGNAALAYTSLGWRADTWGKDLVNTLCEAAAAGPVAG